MSNFPSLPEEAHLSDVFQRFPKGVGPLLALHDALLRSPSQFSIAERELIAAFVSGTNACAFCYGAHTLMARAFGIEAEVFETLLEDPAAAPIDAKMVPVLLLARALTRNAGQSPARETRAVLEAGWSEESLFEAISIVALYNYMNRLVEGAGLVPGPEYLEPAPEHLEARRGSTYTQWGAGLGLAPDETG
ncbi:carboxymuconolactone decarboxylase family protein [Maricaulis sp.]|uniref:carboxymuconolactone decarboxylase family protein n=1 Tax=Maricaulis sp. TaxID=1486257 RepID=UPI003A8E74B7